MGNILDHLHTPEEIKQLSLEEQQTLASELRARIIEQVSKTGGPPGVQPWCGRTDDCFACCL